MKVLFFLVMLLATAGCGEGAGQAGSGSCGYIS